MRLTGKVVLSLGALAAGAVLWSITTKESNAPPAPIPEPSPVASFNKGVLSFCGEKFAVRTGSKDVQVDVLRVAANEHEQVQLMISSRQPAAHPCLPAAVETPVGVLLTCDPPDAPIWSDFSKRPWRSRTERPQDGVIALEGDPTSRLDHGFHFIAAPSQNYHPGEFPFQASCFTEPGTVRKSDRCKVSYKQGRVGVQYSYLTASITPWREVDELVRSALEGRPSSLMCR